MISQKRGKVGFSVIPPGPVPAGFEPGAEIQFFSTKRVCITNKGILRIAHNQGIPLWGIVDGQHVAVPNSIGLQVPIPSAVWLLGTELLG
jgi:hypothetical protein